MAVAVSLLYIGGVAATRILSPAAVRPSATALGAPRFVDDALRAGVGHAYDGEFEFFVGGGVAAFDCDDDGLTDLFFAGGDAAGRAVPQREPRSAARSASSASRTRSPT